LRIQTAPFFRQNKQLHLIWSSMGPA
jgi:hypothetical protein